ncbi:hypothetical protein DV737_g947, partial [Chaetothyriales sp. CBS 132003]
MPLLSRTQSPFLRVGQLAFAAVVAGIIGDYLNSSPPTHPTRVFARWIYTIILALFWLVPLSSSFHSYPIDLLLSLAWFTAFGLFITYNRSTSSCTADSRAFNWGGMTGGGVCNRFRAAQAFSFLSAIFWLASTLVGIWVIQNNQNSSNNGTMPTAQVVAG